jgi:hypothetical protein
MDRAKRVFSAARGFWLSFYKTSHSAEKRGMGHPALFVGDELGVKPKLL